MLSRLIVPSAFLALCFQAIAGDYTDCIHSVDDRNRAITAECNRLQTTAVSANAPDSAFDDQDFNKCLNKRNYQHEPDQVCNKPYQAEDKGGGGGGAGGGAGSGGGGGSGGSDGGATPQKTTKAAKASTPLSNGTAPADASSDVSSCNSALTSGNSACDTSQIYQTGSSSSGASGSDSMTGSCSSMKSAASDDSKRLTNLATQCYSAKSNCSNTCAAALSKWQSQQSNCGSSCDSSINNAVTQLTSLASQCSRLSQNAQQISDAANDRASTSGDAGNCQQASGTGSPSATPSSATPSSDASKDSSSDSSNTADNSDYVNCNNPVNAQTAKCKGDASAAASDGGSNTQPSDVGTNASPSSFNTASADGLGAQQNPLFPPLDAAKPGQANVIANNSGQFGGTPTPPSNGLGSKAPGAPAGASKNTNVLNGERSGGGYSYGSGRSLASVSDASMASSGRRGLASKDDPYGRGLDLKQYLPGGIHDPSRGVGGLNSLHPDILGQGADLFEHVTNRFRARCLEGFLYDCRPPKT